MCKARTFISCNKNYILPPFKMPQTATLLVVCAALASVASATSADTQRAAFLTSLFPKYGLCNLSPEERESVLSQIQDTVSAFNRGQMLVPACGEGLWLPVADVDVNRDAGECPSGWTFFSGEGVEGCTRAEGEDGVCVQASFSTSGAQPYNQVCGRVTGRVTGVADGFVTFAGNVDGVIISHSANQQESHIWSFAVTNNVRATASCPCNEASVINSPLGASIASVVSLVALVGDNYFCDDSGDVNRPLWTGGNCENLPDSCCDLNTPPYFNMTLPTPTSDDIYVSICTDGGTIDKRVFIESIQLFVQ